MSGRDGNPLVSVVIPTYNNAVFLKEAIASVRTQSRSDWEIIVIDNYSDDDTEQFVGSLEDARVRYFKFRNDGVIARSRNFGIERARGQYVAFLDSDDLWTGNKLERQLDYLEQHPEIGMVFAAFRVIGPDESMRGKILAPRRQNVSGYIYDRLLNFDFIVSSSVMVRAGVLDGVGGFDESEELACVEDFDLWLRIARRHRVHFIPEILGEYRVHESNSSANDQRLSKALAVIDKHAAHGWIGKETVRRVRAHFYFREGWTLVDRDIAAARVFFRKALRSGLGSPKIFSISLAGLVLSLLPPLCGFLKQQKIDRRIGSKIIAS